MNDLVNNPPEGINVKFKEEDITDIQASIEGPGNIPSSFLSYWNVTYSMEFLSIILDLSVFSYQRVPLNLNISTPVLTLAYRQTRRVPCCRIIKE